jgi:hypothetical protein
VGVVASFPDVLLVDGLLGADVCIIPRSLLIMPPAD